VIGTLFLLVFLVAVMALPFTALWWTLQDWLSRDK
jgi:hypothetical protein